MKKFFTINGLIYLLILTGVIVLRYWVLTDFAFTYTDSDQSIMWLGLKNYASGLFYEPRFYGQSYNTMLEALLGVPLYKLGIPVYKAPPIVTGFLALFPYCILSLLVFLKRSPQISFLILSIPLLLPVEYSLITSMPRGFVTGIFISSLGCISLFYPKSKVSLLLCSFLAVFAYTVNSNSLLISFPVLLYLFLENVKNKHYYIYSSLGIISGLFVHFRLAYFYVLHPDYNLHKYEISISFQKILTSIGHLDLYFNNVTPLFWKAGYSVLLMFLLISALLLWKKNYKPAIAVGLIPFMVIATLAISKVHDGTASVFFSYSRMYLALPVLLGVSLSFLTDRIRSKLFYFYLLIPFSCFVYQISQLDKAVKINTGSNINHVNGISKVQQILDDCNNLNSVCRAHNVELVIISNHWSYDFFDYGCPACNDTFPNTLRPAYERRTWRLMEDEKAIYRNIMIIDIQRDFASEFTSIKKIPGPEGYYIIEGNTMYTMALLDSLGITYRKYK